MSPGHPLQRNTSGPLSRLREGRALPALAGATVIVMVAVIVWGAVVRITSSGGGCGAHWPLCNGDFFPHHPRLATVIEFTHRATTGLCSTLALLVEAWSFVSRRASRGARIAAVIAVVLLLVEALLGRALVIHGYVENNVSDARSVMQCVHFTNTLALLAAFTLTWWLLRADHGEALRAQPAASTALLAPVAMATLATTLVAGGTGAVAALADTLFPSPSLRAGLAADFAAGAPLLVRMRWVHPAAAALTMALTLLLAAKLYGPRRRLLLTLLAAQILLGAGDVLLLAPAWLQIAHLLLADIFWIALVVIAWEALVQRHRATP